MKKIKSTVPILLMLVVLTGCSSCSSPQRATFNSIATLSYAVDGAYKGYLDSVVTGKTPTNSVPTIAKKYELYQLATRSALAFVSMNSNAPPTADLVSKSTDLLSTINSTKTNTLPLKGAK